MDPHDLRAAILKIQDHLSDNDRKRLHFFLGPDVPRRIRDDPTLVGTINLMESLLDQDKINEQDVSLLINAFEKTQCIDAMKILKEHMKKIQKDGHTQSMQNLALLLLHDQEDTCIVTNLDSSKTTKSTDKSLRSMENLATVSVSKRLKNLPRKTMKFLLLLSVLLNIVLIIILGICIKNVLELRNGSKQKNFTSSPPQISFPRTPTNHCLEIHKPPHKMPDVVWMNARDGEVPPFSVAGGRSGNRSIYIARVEWRDCTIPAQLVAGDKLAEFEYWGPKNSPAYQILTNPNSKLKFEWMSLCGSRLPACALLAGKEGTLDLYIGRTCHRFDTTVVGKYSAPDGPFYYAYQEHGQEVQENVEILCLL
ncbi:unnamed protein product [Adineta ricciae]|uniref:DED domain-containing protein n=1 Tax=Adineta ricciae TaxID=249248 RepID=A0A815JA00_ADIRI|nr:unnamed protein product [Adineta ricciae]CAF1469877.1 unnamed protein product [Adineta ricciae]